MSTETIIFFIAIVLVIGALPAWPHSKAWGYTPTGVLTVLLVIFCIWAIAGGRPFFRNSLGQDIRSVGQDVGDSVRRTLR